MNGRRIEAIGLVTLTLVAAGCARAEPSGPLALERVVDSGLEAPVFVTHAGDGSGRLFVIDQPGTIRVVEDGALADGAFLDIQDKVRAGGERGLLGLAFHPDFPEDPRFFVNYTRRPDGATVIASFRVGPDGAADADSENRLLTVAQPYANHNGGMIAFGPDGLLYIGMGDGGSGGDPRNYAQNPDELLGKMLRIDVDGGDPYAVPDDNPYAGGGGRPEIFATGLRNPWRFSFDPESGALWAGDVGQNAIEEIDLVELGGNYGWRIKEGTRDYEPVEDAPELIPPVVEYAHDAGRCSVTGGYVYRGQAAPDLVGAYIYGDYCSGEIFAFTDGDARVLMEAGFAIASFGENEAGELYVVDHGGAIYRLVRGDRAAS